MNLSLIKVNQSASLRKAIKQLDAAGIGIVICVNDSDDVVGILSDGDFRRSVLTGVNLTAPVKSVMNQNFDYVSKDYTDDHLSALFAKGYVEHVPVLKNGKLHNIITQKKSEYSKYANRRDLLFNDVVIMAGGKGTRLDPFTRILPKPLIPLGEKPIIKVIMDEFGEFGMKNFYVTLNDKGKMIKGFFHDHDFDLQINFIEENKPLGTAGSLTLLKDSLTNSFFLSNCDTIIKTDYSKIVDFHNARNNSLTLVASMHHHTIPYGVCEIENGGDLVKIKEKPEYDFLTNTGLYFIDPSVIDLIPKNTYFDMTSLIDAVQKNKLNVGVFPISEKSWIDIGQWAEYQKTIKSFSF